MDVKFSVFPEVHPFPCLLIPSVICHFSNVNFSVKSLDFKYFSKEYSDEGNALLRVVFIKILAGNCLL